MEKHHRSRFRCSVTDTLIFLLIVTLACNILFLIGAMKRLDPYEENTTQSAKGRKYLNLEFGDDEEYNKFLESRKNKNQMKQWEVNSKFYFYFL